MKVYTFTERIESRRRIGLAFSLTGLVIMGVGLFLLWQPAYSALALPTAMGGLIVASIGTYIINRWVRPPLPEQIISETLQRFDNRYFLLNYADGLPVRHLLLGPGGLLVIHAKRYEGVARYDGAGERWRGNLSLVKLYLRGLTAERLGDPTAALERDVEQTRAWLVEQLPAWAATVPIAGLVLFVSPKTTIEGDPAPIPVASPETLRKQVRALLKPQTPMPRERYMAIRESLEEATGDHEEAAE